MSKYSSYAISVSSGFDIVKCLRHFTNTQKLLAAFVVQCVGQVSAATLRMAFFQHPYESVSCFFIFANTMRDISDNYPNFIYIGQRNF